MAFWADVAATTIYLRNRTPTVCLNYRTPYELWFNQKPAVSHLRPIGSIAFIYRPDGKLNPRAEQGKLIGYDPNTNGYRIVDQAGTGIIISKDVQFKDSGLSRNLPFDAINVPEPAFEWPEGTNDLDTDSSYDLDQELKPIPKSAMKIQNPKELLKMYQRCLTVTTPTIWSTTLMVSTMMIKRILILILKDSPMNIPFTGLHSQLDPESITLHPLAQDPFCLPRSYLAP
jgi:hypothetical protein